MDFEEIKKRYLLYMNNIGLHDNLKTRKRPIIFYRQSMIYLIKAISNNNDDMFISLKDIANLFLLKDHSSIINSINVVIGQLSIKDREFLEIIEELQNNVLIEYSIYLESSLKRIINSYLKEQYNDNELTAVMKYAKFKKINVYLLEHGNGINDIIEIKENKVNCLIRNKT